MVEEFDPHFVFVNLGDIDRLGHSDVTGTTREGGPPRGAGRHRPPGEALRGHAEVHRPVGLLDAGRARRPLDGLVAAAPGDQPAAAARRRPAARRQGPDRPERRRRPPLLDRPRRPARRGDRPDAPDRDGPPRRAGGLRPQGQPALAAARRPGRRRRGLVQGGLAVQRPVRRPRTRSRATTATPRRTRSRSSWPAATPRCRAGSPPPATPAPRTWRPRSPRSSASTLRAAGGTDARGSDPKHGRAMDAARSGGSARIGSRGDGPPHHEAMRALPATAALALGALLTPALLTLPTASGAAPDPDGDDLRRGRARQRDERGPARDAARQRPDRRARPRTAGCSTATSGPPHAPPSPSVAPAGAFPYDQTFLLHSRPGAQRTIYLDFDGQDVSGHRLERRPGRDPVRVLPRACRSTPSRGLHRRREGHRPGRLAAGRRGLRAVRGRRDHPGPRHRRRSPGPGPRTRSTACAPWSPPRTGAAPAASASPTPTSSTWSAVARLPARLGVLRRGRQRPDPDRRVDHPRGRPHARALPRRRVAARTTSSATACGARSWAPATARSPSGQQGRVRRRQRATRTTSPSMAGVGHAAARRRPRQPRRPRWSGSTTGVIERRTDTDVVRGRPGLRRAAHRDRHPG